MIKSSKRIQFELTRLVLVIFVVLLVIIVINFYSFIQTVIPGAVLLRKENLIRLIVFGIVTALLLLGIVAAAVKLFTHRFVGPIPRLIREINKMTDTKQYHTLFVRTKDILVEFIKSVNQLIEKLKEKKDKI